jgi:hypothetical protein
MASTPYAEGDEVVRHRAVTAGLVCAALALGLGIALVDTSPRWDDTGISAALLFVACFILGVVSPRHPWPWAVTVGLWIPALTLARYHETLNVGSLLALAFAGAGAYAGAVVQWLRSRGSDA